MIRCLLFGHEPHPTYETSRMTVGAITRRFTFCTRTRCGQTVSAPAPNARPFDYLTDEERDAVLIDSLIQRLMPEIKVMLLPHLLKRKRAERRIPRKTAQPTESGEG